MSRTITAMFDDRAHADAAVQQLTQQLSITSSDIQMHAADAASTTGGTAAASGDTGFWASLKDLFVPDEDRTTYAEGVRRGSVVVSATVDENMLDQAMDVLEGHGAVDLDTREAEWRQEGWTGTQTVASDAGVASVPSASGFGVAATGTAVGSTTPPAASTAAPAVATTARVGGEEAIPIVEESLRVGKRDVERGRVRVRSYVVETPVSEQVMLHQEHVDVERRVVDRPVTGADAVFQDRTIEATETAEEAVISKEARVTGEVVIRKEATERTETVQDTVRRTEVDIDDTTTDAARARTGVGTAGAAPDDAPGNPPGTMASRAADKTLGTNVSGANPTKR
ncbi:YsnF/AvaK domain-containing protein [Belnapia rosea]|uniref:YsnF/AvaK domain-containing protein n=1 Tax=Belnapia rosea TaxID=938405 RepID=UPI000883E191|nr:YsnF/AvaK domain-containing protein [Belnapia rosea]SDB73067.1 conserved domain-containing protein [Belnapia rosea]